MEITTKSPLGDRSQLFSDEASRKKGILDIPNEGLLQIYPRGYTKPSPRDDGHNRQIVHEFLFHHAVVLKTENDIYPFENHAHTLELIRDLKNPKDRFAINIIMHAPHGLLKDIDGADLGFVPKEISAVICKNIDMITGGKIYKVRSNWHKKYYSAKVVLFYGQTIPECTDLNNLQRFSDLLTEVK